MCYVLPKYYFSGEYEALYPELLSLEHTEQIFHKGDLLWNIGKPITNIFYFRSGLAQTYVEHEDGHRKILSFHGTGTIFPGIQKSDYKIERSIAIKALTDVVTTAFERDSFYQFCINNPALMAQMIEHQSAYINMLIYDAAHQRYNDTFLKLCNFLFLISENNIDGCNSVTITQENIADTLGVGRNHVTKCLSRLRQENIIQLKRRCIKILDLDKLAAYCSLETLDTPFL